MLHSKYCLQSSFGLIVRIFVLPLNTLKTCLHYMLYKYKREKKGSLWGLQKSRKRICHSENDFSSQGFQEYEWYKEQIWTQWTSTKVSIINIYVRLKYKKNMNPKKPKATKITARRVKELIAPVQSVIDRTIRKHCILKQVQK